VKSRRSCRHALLLPCLLLSACTGLFHSDAQPEQTYYLRAAGAEAGAPGSGTATPALSLRVGHITAAPGLESVHIMLVQPDHRMNFYSGSRWPATAPEVIEALAVETLRASGAWSSVEDSASPFPSEYLLQVTLRRFEADYGGAAAAAPVVQVVLDCIIGRREGRDVVGTFVASASAPASANRLTEVVAAFEQATTSALAQLAQQSSQAAHADAQQRSAQNAANPDASIRR